jgi:hypothetical protein
MGEIRLSIGQVNIPDYLIINVREVGNPTVIVQSHVEPPPVPASFNLLFSGLADVVHYVDFRQSADGISQGLLLGTFVYDVKNETIISERRFYRVNGPGPYDPTDLDTSITDPYFDGKTVSGVFKEGFRFLRDGVEWSQTGDTVNITFDPGVIVFMDNEIVSVEITYKAAASASSTTFPKGIIEITADITLDASHENNFMEVNSGANTLTITLPPFSMIPENTKYQFSTENGTQRYTKIVIDNMSVNYAMVSGVQRTVLYMGRSENLVLIKKGNYMRSDWKGDYTRVGDIVYRDAPPLNSVGHFGAWEDIANVIRLYEWYVNLLDPSYFGTGTYPATPSGANRHKWVVDLVNNKIWIPDFGGLFLRCVDNDGNIDVDRPSGDRKPGTYQADAINPAGISIENMSRRGNPDDGGDRTNDYYFIDKSRDTAPNYKPLILTSSIGATETRVKNLNMNVYRII